MLVSGRLTKENLRSWEHEIARRYLTETAGDIALMAYYSQSDGLLLFQVVHGTEVLTSSESLDQAIDVFNDA